MALISISSATIAEYHGTRTPTSARWYLRRSVTAYDNDNNPIVVPKGSQTHPNTYQDIGVTMDGTDVVLDACSLYSTTDSSRPTVTGYVHVYDENGGLIPELKFVLNKIQIPPTPTTTTWEALIIDSGTPISAPDPTLNDQINALITAQFAAKVSKTGAESVAGVKTFASSPVVPTPTADTDASTKKYVDDKAGKVLGVDYASLSSAISSIGTTPTTLTVPSSVTLSTSVTIPANVYLKPENGATITKSGSGAITFNGIGVIGDPRHQIFSGFAAADISWTNEMPDLRLEWFGGRGDNSTDNSTALQTILDLIKTLGTGNKRGGTIRCDGGVYKFTSGVAQLVPYNVAAIGSGGNAHASGSQPRTIWLYSGTGTRFLDLRGAQSCSFQNLGILYSSASFTGTLIDLGITDGVGPTGNTIENCLIGGDYSTGTLRSGADMLVDLSSNFKSVVRNSYLRGCQRAIRLNGAVVADGNVNTITENQFAACEVAAIVNLAQQDNITNNNFEGTNFTSAADGGMPWAIDYDYSAPETDIVFGLNITGNWFGDRTTYGKGYIRVPRIKGAHIAGNFFGGGYNNATDYDSAAIEFYHGSNLHVAGNYFGGGMHCLKATLASGGSTVGFYGNNVTFAEGSETNPNTSATAERFFNRIASDRFDDRGNEGDTVYNYQSANQGFFSKDFGSGDGVIAIGDATTVPSSNPTDAVLMYSQGGMLKVRNSSGQINGLGPGGTLVNQILTTPNIGTPSAGTLTNCTGLPQSGVTNLVSDLAAKAALAGAAFTGAVTSTGLIKSSSASAGVGYTTGAGSTVTQGTSRSTAVSINAVCGAITLVSAAGSTTPTSFTVNNSAVAATDIIHVSQKSGTDKYITHVTAVGAGSFEITCYTTGGTTTEQPVINFAVIKGVTS